VNDILSTKMRAMTWPAFLLIVSLIPFPFLSTNKVYIYQDQKPDRRSRPAAGSLYCSSNKVSKQRRKRCARHGDRSRNRRFRPGLVLLDRVHLRGVLRQWATGRFFLLGCCRHPRYVLASKAFDLHPVKGQRRGRMEERRNSRATCLSASEFLPVRRSAVRRR